MSGKVEAEPKKWDLEAESEYRFELDVDTSLAIKVGLPVSEPWEALLESTFSAR